MKAVAVVEVFTTGVVSKEVADRLLEELALIVPEAVMNFDLEDVDNILRVEHQSIPVSEVINTVVGFGHFCDVLV